MELTFNIIKIIIIFAFVELFVEVVRWLDCIIRCVALC